MKIKYLLAATALLLLSGSAEARFHKGGTGGGAVVSCPQGNAYADGCAGAPVGLMSQSNFWTYARQSGQSAYATRPPWNVAGVDFPVGQTTADNALLDPVTNPPAGCTYNSSIPWLSCGNNATVAHYRMNGVGVSAGPGLTLTDNHFTLNAANCRSLNGTGLVTSSGGITATSNTIDFDPSCQINADLYKQSGDPGLVTQSSGSASLSGTTLTYTAVNSGTVRIGQYIDCPGCTEPAQITAGSGLSWTVSVSQPTIGPVTVTTGPVKSRQSTWISSGAPLVLRYNYNIGYADLAIDGGTDTLEAKYNYSEMHGQFGQHVNFVQIQPQIGGTISSITQSFNTLLWSPDSWRSGTTTIGQFTTSGAANNPTPPGGEVITTLHESNNNTMITNRPAMPGQLSGNVTAAMLRYLSQSSTGQLVNFTGTQSGTTLTVSAISSGAGSLAPGLYLTCASGCSLPIQIVSQLTGSTGDVGTYQVSQSLSLPSSQAWATTLQGEIGTVNWQNNYMDITAADGVYGPGTNVPVGSLNISGNVNILSGNACTQVSCP